MGAGGFVPADDGNDAYWSPVSRFSRADGSAGIYPHTVTDRGKPGVLAVNRSGRRFTNEADSYHDFVKGMFACTANGPSTPAYLICDRRSLWQYGLGAVKPMHAGRRRHLRGRTGVGGVLGGRSHYHPPGCRPTARRAPVPTVL